jgi:AcrR family transcriptional regulator
MAQDTRERILDIARELFTEHGYDGTSLREIADRLGFTKAALYYHFQSKDEILLALLEPVQGLVAQLLGALEAADGIEEWGEVLCWVISQMTGNMPVFRLLQRNRGAIEQVGGWRELMTDQTQMQDRIERAVIEKASGRREQVRMIAAVGAVTGFDDWAPNLMEEIPLPELQAELTAAVFDILGLPPRAVTDEPPAAVVAAAASGSGSATG